MNDIKLEITTNLVITKKFSNNPMAEKHLDEIFIDKHMPHN